MPISVLSQVDSKAGITDGKQLFEIGFSQTEAMFVEEILSHAEIICLYVHHLPVAVVSEVALSRQDETVATHALSESPSKLTDANTSSSHRSAVVEQVNIRWAWTSGIEPLYPGLSESEIIEW